MKKYIITEDQFDDIRALIPSKWSPEARRLFESLKPIELLSDKDLCDIYANVTGQNLLNRETFLMFCFGRAIEAHIIGEKQ